MKTKNIIINSQIHESRIAVTEDWKLTKLLVDRPSQRRLLGNIYKGTVENVLSGIQAAFIEFGAEKRAFLHISDIGKYNIIYQVREKDDSGVGELIRKRVPKDASIDQLFSKGDKILIQILKESIGSKGARATTELSLPGRYLVVVPGANVIGVSRRIKDQKHRRRLRRLARQFKIKNVGIIVRTIAEEQDLEIIQADYEKALAEWESIRKKAEAMPAPCLLSKDMGMVASIVREYFSKDVGQLILDKKQAYKKMLTYIREVAPSLSEKVTYYKGDKPVFDAFNIESQIREMMARKIEVARGIDIVIDRTEALVAIDVNAGNVKVGKTPDDTILNSNIKAAKEIVRQIKLRDLGGLLVIDFIDMKRKKNRAELERKFKEYMADEKHNINIIGLNRFGLMILTRKRVRPSLIQSITDKCPVCNGLGAIESPSSIIVKIERWLIRASAEKNKDFTLITHPKVAIFLMEGEVSTLQSLEENYDMNLHLFADATIKQTEFVFINNSTCEDLTNKYLY